MCHSQSKASLNCDREYRCEVLSSSANYVFCYYVEIPLGGLGQTLSEETRVSDPDLRQSPLGSRGLCLVGSGPVRSVYSGI